MPSADELSSFYHFLLRHLQRGTVDTRSNWNDAAQKSIIQNVKDRDVFIDNLTESDEATWAHVLMDISHSPELVKQGYFEQFYRISPFSSANILCFNKTEMLGDQFQAQASLSMIPGFRIYSSDERTLFIFPKYSEANNANRDTDAAAQTKLPFLAESNKPRC